MTFAGLDIAELSRLPLEALAQMLRPYADGDRREGAGAPTHPEKAIVAAADRRGPGGAARRAARPRARLPVARAQHADAVAGRTAAAAAGDAGALEPVRRRLRARRAVGRPAPGRHRSAAARARPAEGGRQLAVRRRARARRDPPRRLDRRRRARPPGSTAARFSTAARPPGSQRSSESQTRRVSVRRATALREHDAADAARLAAAGRRDAQQPARARRRVPARRVDTVTGVSGSGKSSLVSQVLVELVAEHLGHAARRRTTRRPSICWSARAPLGDRRPDRRRRRADRRGWSASTRSRSAARPRSNLATYTGLFDHVRKLFAATQAAARAALRRRPVLVQRRQGALRALRRAKAS